jgi:hypothetical protein
MLLPAAMAPGGLGTERHKTTASVGAFEFRCGEQIRSTATAAGRGCPLLLLLIVGVCCGRCLYFVFKKMVQWYE